MNKLDALRTLSHAYWHANDTEAQETLAHAFGYVRRSLRLEDLKPASPCREGYNGRGPTFL